MNNLPVEVTHSLSFLTNTLRDIKTLSTSSSDIVNELYKMDLKKDGAPGQIRKKSSDFRDDIDEDIDFILEDFKLFQKEMSDIVKHKDDETVIYSLKRFRELYRDYKDLKKELDKLNRRTDIKTSKCIQDKDYVRYIAVNKTSVPIYKLIQIVDACIYGMDHLVGDKKETKKEA